MDSKSNSFTAPAHSSVTDPATLKNRYVKFSVESGEARLVLAAANNKPIGVATSFRGRNVTVVDAGMAKVITGAEIAPATVREVGCGASGVAVVLAAGAFKAGRVRSRSTVASGGLVEVLVEVESVVHA